MGIDWNDILKQAVQEAMPYLLALIGIGGTILITYATLALNQLRSKLAVSAKVDADTLSKSVVKQATFAAEEKSAQNAAILGGIPDTGRQKLTTAIAFVQARLPDKPVEEVLTDINASLGATKGLGASKAVGEVPAPVVPK